VISITGAPEQAGHNELSRQGPRVGPVGKEATMKSCLVVVFIIAMAALLSPALAGPKNENSAVPKYNSATEVTVKGVVEEVHDRQCPVSGGMGAHIILKQADGKTIEVHLATTKFVKSYDLIFAKGDELEVTGSKVTLEGVETILAREVKRGNDTFVFRDKAGNPVW
jgi:DNA/RNA endonuclease YhcR with UshA esterase domain